MATYSYIYMDKEGTEGRGLMEAANEREVMITLRSNSWTAVEIEEGGRLAEPTGLIPLLKKINPLAIKKKYAKVKALDQIIFFRQISLMIRAGYTVLDALETSQNIVEKPRLKAAVGRMTKSIQEGKTLSAAMLDEDKIFSKLTSKLIASGEATGDLDVVLERVSVGMERSADVKRTIVSALVYPAITLLLAIGVVYMVISSVIPKFVKFLGDRDTELPALTQFMVDFSNWLELNGLYLAIGIGVVVFGILVAMTTEKGLEVIHKVMIRAPLIGTMQIVGNMADMGWLLNMLLKSQVTVLDSLKVMNEVTGHKVYAKIFGDAAKHVLNGNSLSSGMDQKFVPPMVPQLIKVGEKSGELEKVMEEIGEYYTRELASRIKIMIALLEPLMLIFVGGVVAVVYLSIFSAIFKVASGGK